MNDRRPPAPSQATPPADGAAAEPGTQGELRRQAEARLLRLAALPVASIDALSAEETRRMLHELQVHQIELEMQNEELRDAQVALDVERARYFDLYDLAPVGYCTVGGDGLVSRANLTLAGLLDTTRSELIGQRWTRFIDTQDTDLYHLHLHRLLETGEPQSCELRMKRRGGGQFWGLWAASVSPDGQGAPEIRAVLSDISTRKRTEDALRERSEQYHHLFTSIGEGFCVIDVLFDEAGKAVDYRFVELNPSFEAQSGLHQAMGKRASELVPNLEPHWYEIYGGVALTGEPVRFLEQAREMQGRWFDVHAYRLGGPESRRVAILFNDSSERMQVQIKLREAKEAADKANRAKSEFLSNMSHELRTPLNAILGFAQLIDTGPPVPSPTQKRNVDYILKAGWYLLALVDEILDLAVVESGKLSLSMQSVGLEEIMGECRAMLEQQARTRGITLSFPRFDAPCHVSADRTRLKQVLSNLLSNAIKYNRPEGSVDVDWVVVSPGRVRISVRDSGEGLSAEKLPQLFQPFNRLGKENGSEQGTGIGLVVSKRAIEMMGGAIGVHSVAGAGSVFWIELDLAAPPPTAAAAPPDPAAAGPAAADKAAPDPAIASQRTVLYVEDNPANLALMAGFLSHRPDLRLLTATDGDSGVALARAQRPDAIVMDINLPVTGGVEAMQILARDPATARIPVIALSANATSIDIERGLAAGFFRYLTKPIRMQALLETLDTALERPGPPGAPLPPRHRP